MTKTASITIQPSGAALGADIAGVDISQPLDEATFDRIEAAWHEHLVLRFRDVRLSDAQLVAFSRRFGDLDGARLDEYKEFVPGQPEIIIISNVNVNGQPIGILGADEADWHTDLAYEDTPPKASLLYSWEVPQVGGNTSFLNMYLAFETLAPELKAVINGKSCKHDSSHRITGALRGGGEYAQVTDPREAPGSVHPVVRTHPMTDRKALYLGRRRLSYVMGMTVEDSEMLLDSLWLHAQQKAFAWTHVWRPADLILWDNRCTMHQRDAFDPSSRRIMHRTQVKGDKPR
jgi:taurine dioxygenase